MEAQDRPLLSTQEKEKPRTSDEYDDLSDGAPDVRGLRSSNERKLWPWLVVCSVTSAIIFGLLGALACATLRDFKLYFPPKDPDCGNSLAEAIAKGCHFDQQTLAWIPEQCRSDPKSIEEYNKWLWDPARQPRPFPYFADQEGKIWIQDAETLSRQTGPVWTTWEEHMTHCAFMAKRFMRTWSHGKHIDNKMGNGEHAAHCSEMLTNIIRDGMHNNSLINTRFGIDYSECQLKAPIDNEEGGGYR